MCELKSKIRVMCHSNEEWCKIWRVIDLLFQNWHSNEEWCKIWRVIDLLFQNWHEDFDKFLPEHSKISKIYTLTGSFWSKYMMVDQKKYRGVIFHVTEEWCKIWRKTDLWFGNWHEKFGKFSPEHLKVSKLRLWLIGSFYPN